MYKAATSSYTVTHTFPSGLSLIKMSDTKSMRYVCMQLKYVYTLTLNLKRTGRLATVHRIKLPLDSNNFQNCNSAIRMRKGERLMCMQTHNAFIVLIRE